MMKTLFKNARIVLKDDIFKGDLLIENKLIKEIGINLKPNNATVVDLKNQYILPGFVDLNCVVTDPGYDYKENLATLTKAALAGGFTTILAQPNTHPFVESKMAVEYVKNKFAAESILDLKVAGSLTKNEILEEEIAEIYEMKRAGISALSDGARSIMNIGLLNEILKYCELVDIPVFLSSIQRELVGERFVIEGPTATLLGVDAIPKEAQNIALATNIILAKDKDINVHFNNVTSRDALEIYANSKKNKPGLTASVSAHYIGISEEKLQSFNSVFKIMPCLRTKDDTQAVIEYIMSGDIDCITSGHRPETIDTKKLHLGSASYGVSSLETAFLYSYNKLVVENNLDFNKFINLFTLNPARILQLKNKGEIKVGNVANLVVFDENDSYLVDSKQFKSKAKYSMFDGELLKGRIKDVYINGMYVNQDELYNN